MNTPKPPTGPRANPIESGTMMTSLPERAVERWLQVLRLPMTLTESILRRSDGQQWPPMLAFEGFEAFVRESAGRLLGDEQLLDHARLQRAEIAQRRQAILAHAEASERARAAEAEFEQKRKATEEKRERAERQAAERQANLDRERREAKRRLQQETAEREEVAQQAVQRREQSVQAQERVARTKRLDAEDRALVSEKEAVQAKGEALDLARAAKATKARRKVKS